MSLALMRGIHNVTKTFQKNVVQILALSQAVITIAVAR